MTSLSHEQFSSELLGKAICITLMQSQVPISSMPCNSIYKRWNLFLQGKVEAYGSQSELISQGVNPAHLLGLKKAKEERDEFLCKGDDDEDEEEKGRNGGLCEHV